MAFLQEYSMLDELGKGGFATVYKVRHNEYGYIRAVRVLNETIINESSKTYQKFLRECKVLLRLGNGNHPNIVHIYQPRLLENKALVEMDYVDGQDLAHYLKQEGSFVATTEVVRMATQISNALAYCHEDIYRFCMDRDEDKLKDDPNDGSKVLLDDKTRQQLIAKYKVIHNDIHSGNIIRREDGNYVLLDFGLAINGDEVVHSSRHANGAPEFKAPEKWDDESILTEQSDIYSFGIVLYQYLAGRVPFPFNTKNSNKTEAEYQLSKAHQNTPPPSIEMLRMECFEKKYSGWKYQKDYPEWLEEMILKCLRKNPEERFRNGKELYKYIIEHTGGNNEEFYKTEIDRLNHAVTEYASKTGDLQNENDALQTSLDEKQEELSGLNDQLYHTQQSLTEANNQKEGLQTQLGKKGRMTKILLAILVVCVGYGLYMTLHYKTATLESPNEIDSTIAQLAQQLKDKDNEINRLKKSVVLGQNNQTEIATLNRTIEEKEKIIKEKNNEIEAMRKTAVSGKNASADIAKLKTTIAEKEKTIDKLQASLRQEQAEVKNMETQLAKARSSNSGNSSEITTLRNKVSQKEIEIAALNTKLDNLQKRLAKANREIEILRGNM